jgi:DNA-binding HxlR family transcriptional regulator
MTESTWKVVMDGDGVTISGDQFSLTTNGSDPRNMETVVSELQSVTRATYGQYCGLSRAIEMVGERWGLLIIRDLLVSPKTEAELSRGLPLIPARLLSMRLRELTFSGVITPVDGSAGADAEDADGDSGAGRRYELTEYGRALEDTVLALGRWGAMALAAPRPEDVVTEDAVLSALKSTYHRDAAKDVTMTVELHVGGVVVHTVVDAGRLELHRGPTSDADLVVYAGLELKALLNGDLTPADALESGDVTVTGSPDLLDHFVEMFHLPQLPRPVAA